MAQVKIKLNSKAMREILRSQRVLGDLERRAAAIAAAAGPGHVVEGNIGRNRARAAVITATPEAMRAEAKNRTLTRAIDAGR